MTETPDPSTQRSLLRIYLNDHLMGATAGLAVAKRTAGANRGTRFGAPLEALIGDLAQDRNALLGVMRAFGVPVNRLKVTAATVGERVGRLKLNGQLRGYSPLSRVVELEGLLAGVNAKLGLWRALRHIAAQHPELSAEHLDQLIARAEAQTDQIEGLRLDAAALALGGPASV